MAVSGQVSSYGAVYEVENRPLENGKSKDTPNILKTVFNGVVYCITPRCSAKVGAAMCGGIVLGGVIGASAGGIGVGFAVAYTVETAALALYAGFLGACAGGAGGAGAGAYLGAKTVNWGGCDRGFEKV